MIRYNIIATGSTGNAVKINDILIDCGVSFKKLKDVYKHIKLVLLTHEHSDHFRPSTIRKLAAERPTLRFGCCRWMVPKLIECHDVPNCGYRLYFGRKRVLYATDTRTMQGISAKGYDYYFIEANYKKEEIKRKIADKKEQGEYAYEVRAMNEHLSQEEAEDFIYSNMTSKSRYIFLHEHIDK